MAAKLIESLWVSAYGSAAASGSVQFFAPGTLIRVTVYKDDAATQPASQPVSLDANGRTIFPLYATAPARAIIADANGATLEDIDRIDGDRAELVAVANTSWPLSTSLQLAMTNLASSLGGTDGQYKTSVVGGVNRTLTGKLADTPSVKDFGAKGDGVTDDTQAFNVALAAISSPGVLDVPAGTYLTSSPISIGLAGTTLRGAGRFVSIIKNTSGTGNGITIGNVANVSVFDLGVTHNATSTGNAIGQTATTYHYYRGLNLAGHRRGISGLVGKALDVDVTTDASGSGIGFVPGVGDCEVISCSATTSSDGGINGLASGLPTSLSVIGCRLSCLPGRSIYLPSTGSSTQVPTVCVGNRFTNATNAAPMDFSNGQGGFNAMGNIGPGAAGVGWGVNGNGASNQSTAINATLTMDISRYFVHKLKATAAPITLTYAFVGNVPPGQPIFIVLQNSSGGAPTYTPAAGIITTSTNPTNTNEITGIFYFDDSVGKLVQAGAWSANQPVTG